MRTKEEIIERKKRLKDLYQAKRTNKDGKTLLVGAMRELDWVLGGTE